MKSHWRMAVEQLTAFCAEITFIFIVKALRMTRVMEEHHKPEPQNLLCV